MELIYWYVAGVAAQVAIWQKLYDPNGLFLAPVISWIMRSPTRKANVVKNSIDEMKAYSIPTDDEDLMVKNWVVGNVAVFVHHGLAVGFAFSGWCFSSTLLYRIALTFEIGEDVLHYLQMAYSLIFPPGVEPWKSLPKFLWSYVALHHVVGLVAGSLGFFYLSDDADVHKMVFFLLWSVLPAYFKAPLALLASLQEVSVVGQVAAMLDVFGFLNILYTRFIGYVPLGVSICRTSYNVDKHVFYGAVFGLCTALLFHMLAFAVAVPGLIATIRKQFLAPSATVSTKEIAPLLSC